MVDGDAIWRSKKIRRVPEELRIHYAFWLPLAEANGVFEADPEMIWSRLYAFMMPDIDVQRTEEILDAFREADLIRTWEEKGKVWGFFAGINQDGRLPSSSQLPRYKNLPPNPPEDVSYNESEVRNPTFVYFAKAGQMVKIGASGAPVGRVQGLLKGANKAQIVGLMLGGFPKERELHKKFADYRIDGEWFELCPQIQQYIEDNASDSTILERASRFRGPAPIQTNPDQSITNQSTGDEGVNTPLRVETDIRELVRVHFPGPPPETLTSEQRKALRAKADQFGHHALPGLFDAWAAGQETAHRRPISVFLGYEPKKSEIDALEATTAKSPVSKDELKKCLLAIAKASGGTDGVVVGPRYHAAISEALADYGHETVLQAFRTFWSNFSGEKKWAELDFSGKVMLQCELALESKREAEQLELTMAAARKELETMPLLAAQTEEGDENAEIEI